MSNRITIVNDEDEYEDEYNISEDGDGDDSNSIDIDSYEYINSEINNLFSNPKTPYELFIRRLNMFKYQMKDSTRKVNENEINYLTLENIICSKIIRFELINRPITLKNGTTYLIETDQINREYSLFRRSSNSAYNIKSDPDENYISPYKGENQLIVLSKKTSKYTVEIKNLIYKEYRQLINKEFEYKTISSDKEYVKLYPIIHLTWYHFQSKLDEGLVISNRKVTMISDPNSVDAPNYPLLFKVQSPNRVFTVVHSVNYKDIIQIIKDDLHSTDEEFFKLYKLYTYYLYIAHIPIDSYYRLVEFIPISELSNRTRYIITHLKDKGYISDKIKSIKEIYSRDIYIHHKQSDYRSNGTHFSYFDFPRSTGYKNSIKQVIYNNITKLYSNKNNMLEIRNSKDIKELELEFYLLTVHYDEYYVNEMYNIAYDKDFPYRYLFNYELLKWLPPQDENNYDRNHPSYYSEIKNKQRENQRRIENLIDEEFNISDPEEYSDDYSSDNENNNNNPVQFSIDNNSIHNIVSKKRKGTSKKRKSTSIVSKQMSKIKKTKNNSFITINDSSNSSSSSSDEYSISNKFEYNEPNTYPVNNNRFSNTNTKMEDTESDLDEYSNNNNNDDANEPNVIDISDASDDSDTTSYNKYYRSLMD